MNKEGQNSGVLPASKGSKGAAESGPEALSTSDSLERHYTPEQLADLWNLSPDVVRRLFENEPGVFVLEGNGMRYGKRRYRTLRIPASVAERVHRRLSVVKGERFPLTGQQKQAT